jgi:hypothetical protein
LNKILVSVPGNFFFVANKVGFLATDNPAIHFTTERFETGKKIWKVTAEPTREGAIKPEKGNT